MKDRLINVLMEPRPWPKPNGAGWMLILYAVEIALVVVGSAWLVTK